MTRVSFSFAEKQKYNCRDLYCCDTALAPLELILHMVSAQLALVGLDNNNARPGISKGIG